MNDSAVSSLPEILVKVGSRMIPQEELNGLTEILVQQQLGLPTLCELSFREPRGPLEPVANWQPGDTLWIGLKNESLPLFLGEITAQEFLYLGDNTRELFIRAYDSLHRLRKRQSVRMWEDVSLTRIVRELGRDFGSKIKMPGSTMRWTRLYQAEQNDFDLLVDLASQDGLFPTVREDTLHLISLEGLGDTVPLEFGESLHDITVEINSEAVASRVKATGWNRADISMLRGEAKTPRSGRDVRTDISSRQVGGQETRYLLNEAVGRSEHLDNLAQADLDYRFATGIHIRGSASGNPAYRPGTRVEVNGLNRQINGIYVLTQITHSLTADGGYSAQFSSEPPELPERKLRDVTTYGVVTNNADPSRYGRIQVRLPAYNDLETDWLQIMMPGAGSGKGFVALPSDGDLVIILLHDGDPGQAVALGTVFGSKQIPDTGQTALGIQQYSWVSPGGQKIQLDDRGNKIRLETDAGAYIELANGTIDIVGNRIDFRRINLAEKAIDETEQAAALSEEIKEDMSRWLQEQNQKGRLGMVILGGVALLALLALIIYFLVQTIGQAG